ncbi:MAG: type II secretion system protein J [Phycisphaerales bacterium]
MTRPAFTMLEMLLAMALGAIVLTTAGAVFAMTARFDGQMAARAEGVRALAQSQSALRRAAQSLIAYPDTPNQTAGPQRTDAAAERFGEESIAEQRGLVNRQEDQRPPRLSLGPVPGSARRGLGPVRRLELSLTGQPFAALEHTGRPIRGAFDIVPGRSDGSIPGAVDGQEVWALLWTPLDPPGEPTILIDDLVLAEFACLDAAGFHDTYEAREPDEFPWAIRAVLWTAGGARADWMLEPGIRIGEAAAQ